MQTNYESARSLIRDGDLIAVRGHGLFASCIRAVTQSEYTHTGVACWLGHRLMIAESRGGVAAFSPVSQYDGVDFDVFDCPVDRDAAVYAALDVLGMVIRYDYADLGAVAAHELFGIPLPAEDGSMICSAVTAAIYKHQRCRWQAALPSIPVPRDIVAAVGIPPKLTVNA